MPAYNNAGTLKDGASIFVVFAKPFSPLQSRFISLKYNSGTGVCALVGIHTH